MIDLGLPYISGYKPRSNYQGLLKEITAACLDSFPELIKVIEIDVNKCADLQNMNDILNVLVYPPASKGYGIRVRENLADYNVKKSTLLRINYLAREAANISLGSAGEKFVLKYEKTRLESIEKFNLADRIEQVSETKGDWAGYDIRSFDDNGNDRFIEVKTTRYRIDTPFFVTKNELGFSTENSSNYNLYRVFAFHENPKLFMLQGSLDKSCQLGGHYSKLNKALPRPPPKRPNQRHKSSVTKRKKHPLIIGAKHHFEKQLYVHELGYYRSSSTKLETSISCFLKASF